MSSYHIAKDGQQTGPIGEEVVRQQIARGALSASDLCWCDGMAAWQPLGTVFSFAQKADTPLPNRPMAATSRPHQLTTFPVAAAVLLHFLTLGIFTLVWLNLMHGKMGRVRDDDPSAGKAVGFCFIPFFNLYWLFFTYRRLCLRLDEQRGLYALPPGNLRSLATTACIFQVIPYANLLLGYTIITPIFIGMMQSSVNQLVHASATTAPRTTLPASSAPARGMSGCVIAAIVCACLIPFIGILAAALLPAVQGAQSHAKMSAMANKGRGIWVAVQCANMEREPLGMAEVWPTDSYATSTDYFKSLTGWAMNGTTPTTYASGENTICADLEVAMLAGSGVPCADGSETFSSENNAWSVVAQSGNEDVPDETPFLFTRNIAVMIDEGQVRLQLTDAMPLGKRGGVVVSRNGAVMQLKQRDLENYARTLSPALLSHVLSP